MTQTARHAAPVPLPRRFVPARADLPSGRAPLLMGVVNVTPDSFSDGGDAETHEAALRRALDLISESADIVDIGGESTRPGADPVDAATETARVLPVIERLRTANPGIPISIDTYKASVADRALTAGADIVNDVWGLTRDPDIARVTADHQAPVIINHWDPERPRDGDVVAQIGDFFRRAIDQALTAGIAESDIVLDPGLGFTKAPSENYVILDRLDALSALGFPLLIGASRKSFIGRATGRAEPKDRLAGTLAYHTMAALKGADILRAHDIGPHRDMLHVLAAARTGTVS